MSTTSSASIRPVTSRYSGTRTVCGVATITSATGGGGAGGAGPRPQPAKPPVRMTASAAADGDQHKALQGG